MVSPDVVSIISQREYSSPGCAPDVVTYDGARIRYPGDYDDPWCVRPEEILYSLREMLDNASSPHPQSYVYTCLPYGRYAQWTPDWDAYRFGCTMVKLTEMRRAAEEIERRWCAAPVTTEVSP